MACLGAKVTDPDWAKRAVQEMTEEEPAKGMSESAELSETRGEVALISVAARPCEAQDVH